MATNATAEIGAPDAGAAPERPDLYLVQDDSVPVDRKIALVLSLNDEAWAEGGLVSQMTLPRDVAIGAFERLVEQRHIEYYSKPPSERDPSVEAKLHPRSDQLLRKIPSEEHSDVVHQAYSEVLGW